jgi:DNA-binding XRE family transcriptional regulator
MKSPTSLRQWATLILQVRAGQLTATEAARQLRVSRKTYYQWERRALRGLLQALRLGRPGRPRSGPSLEVQRLRRKVKTLEQRLATAEQVARLRQILAQLKAPLPRAKKGGSSKRS